MTMLGMGGAIGTGLFLGSSLAISEAGPGVIIAYAACALIALVIAFALAEMVSVHPVTGSFGALAQMYLGAGAGFVVRWTYWAIEVIAVGGELIAVGIYTQYWWPALPLWLPVAVFSIVLLLVNAITVSLFGEIEYWFSMVKVAAIVAFILIGGFYLFFGLPGRSSPESGNLTAHGGFLPHGVHGLALAFVFAFFSFIGTEVVAVTAAESRDPVRDIPRAARSMIVRLSLFYILAIAIVVTLVPWTVTAGGGTVSASPFVRLFAIAGLPAAASVMNFVVFTAALSSSNTNIYLATRMLHSLGQDGYAPRSLSVVSRSGVPRLALLVSAAGLGLAAILSAYSPDNAYEALFGISVFGALVVWILILVTHAAFRREHGQKPAPVRLRGAPVTTALATLALAGILVSTAFINGLSIAWKAGVPFFVVLVVTFGLHGGDERVDQGVASRTMLNKVAWNAARSSGGIAARRSLMALSRATATVFTACWPAGVERGIRTRRSRCEAVRASRPDFSSRSRIGTRVDLSMPSSEAISSWVRSVPSLISASTSQSRRSDRPASRAAWLKTSARAPAAWKASQVRSRLGSGPARLPAFAGSFCSAPAMAPL
jgi:L-asparagine transporter-like permease